MVWVFDRSRQPRLACALIPLIGPGSSAVSYHVIPVRFSERMRALLGPEAERLLSALAEPPLTGLRVNTLKLETLQPLTSWQLSSVPWCPTGFIVPNEVRPGKHPYHAAGLYYLQDPSAMAVAEALAPEPGEWVCDLAAAPGGKSTHLLSLMADQGALITNEVARGRLKALGENLERWGARHAVITNNEVSRLARVWGAVFDRVLLDAPCSGEGMFRKSVEALTSWSEAAVLGCAARQEALLAEAAELVRPGGVLVYSTCTFAPEENEQVIAKFLTAHRELELVSTGLSGTSPGEPAWVPESCYHADLSKAARLWPHRQVGEGHFVAKLRRTEGSAPARAYQPLTPAPASARTLWREFVGAALTSDPVPDLVLVAQGEQLYAWPERLPRLSGLSALRAGLWLGTLKTRRFEPSHALALVLAASQAQRTLALAPDDPLLLRYLAGDVLEEAGEDGWLLVTVAGFPSGWGKRSQGVVKNNYPRGLRRAIEPNN